MSRKTSLTVEDERTVLRINRILQEVAFMYSGKEHCDNRSDIKSFNKFANTYCKYNIKGELINPKIG